MERREKRGKHTRQPYLRKHNELSCVVSERKLLKKKTEGKVQEKRHKKKRRREGFYLLSVSFTFSHFFFLFFFFPSAFQNDNHPKDEKRREMVEANCCKCYLTGRGRKKKSGQNVRTVTR